MVLTFYTAVHALAVIGSRSGSLSATGTWTTDGGPSNRVPPTSTVDSRYVRDRWSFRWGVGVRLRWFPE